MATYTIADKQHGITILKDGEIFNVIEELNKLSASQEARLTEGPVKRPGSNAGPWPLHSIVTKLVEATTILLDGKDYDGHGWEQIHTARAEAVKWLKQ